MAGSDSKHLGARITHSIMDELKHVDNSWVVVAIPSNEDQVWKVSSEKVPHLTMLYLDGTGLDSKFFKITEFVSHVANTSLNRFGLQVDHRGVLGDDEADVLFFEKNHSAKMLEQVRHFLLTDEDLNKAYHSAKQYPSWTPHLTLGYPNSPAKPDEREHPGFHWVEFDRIALWNDDYEGPEFRLKSHSGLEVAMSDANTDILEHYGVKGMKWGIRKSDGSGGSGGSSEKAEAKAQKKVAKAQKKWERTSASSKTFFQIHDDAARDMNNIDIPRINNKPQYKDANMLEDTPLSRKYHKEIEDAFTKRLNESSQRRLGTSPDGSKRLKLELKNGDIHTRWENVKHSAEFPEIKIKTDENGLIISFRVVDDTLVQGESTVDDILEHYGVKGMKWGIRRSDKQLAAAREASGDSAQAKETIRSIKDAGGKTDHLSNKELQNLLDRMNLEQRYSKMLEDTSKAKKGEKKVKSLLSHAKTIQEIYSILNGPLGKALKKQMSGS